MTHLNVFTVQLHGILYMIVHFGLHNMDLDSTRVQTH